MYIDKLQMKLLYNKFPIEIKAYSKIFIYFILVIIWLLTKSKEKSSHDNPTIALGVPSPAIFIPVTWNIFSFTLLILIYASVA